MKKLIALYCSLCIVICMAFAINYHSEKVIAHAKDKYFWTNTKERNASKEILSEIIKDNSVVILGSSELHFFDNIAFPSYLFNMNNPNMTAVLIGSAYCQSLHHAINVAALSDIFPKHKVVLILSPQWFESKYKGIEHIAFSNQFLESIYKHAIKNEKLDINIKRKLADCVLKLLELDDVEYERVEKINDSYFNNRVIDDKFSVRDIFYALKWKYTLSKQLKSTSIINQSYSELNNFSALMERAYKVAIIESTNNEFGISNYFWDDVYKRVYKYSKNAHSDINMRNSPEYDDLTLFLQICKNLDIDLLLINIPVNGYWYDYIGVSKAERELYYDKIRNLCKRYNAKIADFSEKEYEKFFLKDSQHIGWKGWVYIDKAIYDFYMD